jgi:hypothetical protein
MTSVTTDRLSGITGGVAIKAPCIAATSGNITLSGLQTIDAPSFIFAAEGDRVLVRLQTNEVENGIYVASSGDWVRAVDFNGAKDIVSGTYVRVNNGVHRGLWYVNNEDPIVIGTSVITFTKIIDNSSPNIGDLIGTSDDITEGVVNLFFLDDERTKLAGIAAGAEVNVNADWNAVSGDALILNKPTLGVVGTIAAQDSDDVTITGGTATFSSATITGNLTFGGTALTDITGADTRLVSGTAGTSGNIVVWNGDGDAVGGSIAAANILVDADIGVAVQAFDADILVASDIGVSVQAFDADTLKADTTDVLTTGYATTPFNAGTISSGTVTPSEANGNMQFYVNGGAHTLAPPANNTVITLQVTNNGSAGAITTSGFTVVTGDALTLVNGDDFLIDVRKVNGFSHLHVTALQ